jgi:hypothetical protein
LKGEAEMATHTRSTSDVAVIGIDIGKDIFHLLGFDDAVSAMSLRRPECAMSCRTLQLFQKTKVLRRPVEPAVIVGPSPPLCVTSDKRWKTDIRRPESATIFGAGADLKQGGRGSSPSQKHTRLIP